MRLFTILFTKLTKNNLIILKYKNTELSKGVFFTYGTLLLNHATHYNNQELLFL